MDTLKLLFWISIIILFYTYIGYGIIISVAATIKRKLTKPELSNSVYEPEVTILIAAFNEKDYIKQKTQNTFNLDYPAHKLKQVWVTDGSNDESNLLLQNIAGVSVLHQPERKGKVAAINRAMPYVETPIVIFSDANTILNRNAVKNIVKHFRDKKVGCVAGEKRIVSKKADNASGAGEGLYWKYESQLKKWDSQLNSAIGAAGELFAIRTELYENVEENILLDDFIISLRIACKNYKIVYESDAYAIENASLNVKEELKRKIRISAGGIQSIIIMKQLWNFMKHPILSFQFISHRAMRWTIAPLLLPIVFLINMALVSQYFHQINTYSVILILQTLFYLIALCGWLLSLKSIKVKLIYIPYYFFIMNYSVYAGFIRLVSKNQNVLWAKVQRAQ